MPGPSVYASVDSAGVATGTAISSPYSCSVSEGTRNIATLYFKTSDNVTGVSASGTDTMVVSWNATSVSIDIPLSEPVTNHKLKESYSFNLVVTSAAGTTTIAVTASVKAKNAMTVLAAGGILDATNASNYSYRTSVIVPANSVIIDEGVQTNAVVLSCDEIEAATYTLDTHASGDDNNKVTMTSAGVISLKEIASSTVSPLIIKITATSGYSSWETNYTTNVVKKTITVVVSDGSPVFLNGVSGSGGSVKYTNYSFTVDDVTKTLSDTGNIYMNDLCLFTLTGTDASKFDITPTTGGTASRLGQLSLKANASYQTQNSYTLNVVATDSTGNSSTRAVTVAVNSDLVKPNLTLAKVGTATLDNSTTVSISDTFSAGDFATITADENCTIIVISGTDSTAFNANFNTSYANNVLTISSKGETTNSQATYNLTATATDSSPQANTNTLNFTIKVVDKTKPTITASSPQVNGNGATNVFTNATTVAVTFSSNEALSRNFAVSDFTITTSSGATIDQTHGSFSNISATIYVNIPTSTDAAIQAQQENQLITITLAAGQVHDAHNTSTPYNTNNEVTFKFQYLFDANATQMEANGNLDTTIPQGYAYADAGLKAGLSHVVVTNPVDVKTPGIYYVTYVYTSPSTGLVSSLTRKVTVTSVGGRTKPVISTKGLSPSNYTLNSGPFSNADEAANNVNAINNSLGNAIVITVANNINMAIAGSYSVTYNGSDDIYGALQQLIRSVVVGTFTGTAHFKLSQLSSSMTLTNQLLETAVAGFDDNTMDLLPGVEIDMNADDWSHIFWLKPAEPTDGGSGLSDLSDLANINVFATDAIDYKTMSANLHKLTDIEKKYITLSKSNRKNDPTGTLNNLSSMPNQTISEAATNRWGFDIFGQEFTQNISAIFSNLNIVKDEINTKLTGSGTGTLDAGLKSAINSANGKTNSDTGLSNLTRQLLLQLHDYIAPNGVPGTEAYRLTNTGIFTSGNKDQDGYFAFTFLPGDKLTLKLTLNHPSVNASNYYMLNGAQLMPQAVNIKVHINFK